MDGEKFIKIEIKKEMEDPELSEGTVSRTKERNELQQNCEETINQVGATTAELNVVDNIWDAQEEGHNANTL
ncbi:unnamed protein product [Leptidea sinapis]|uniref:Uncharacterized protein n=1 Tax=Leptidea sinapis TaxID=189913 RepID=A0A5E4QBH9_9NEOP|nr:unnamed protein product [Leptidea sinapis]